MSRPPCWNSATFTRTPSSLRPGCQEILHMVIPPGDYQGPLCSGVGLPSSLSVLTLTPGRTWALSSPHRSPCFSHQVPIFSQTCMCDRLSVLVSPQGLPGPTTGAGICGVPSGLTQGPPQSSFRHLTLRPVRTWDSRVSPTEAPAPYTRARLSKNRMSGSQATPLSLILSHGHPGLITETGYSEVSSDCGPRYPIPPSASST